MKIIHEKPAIYETLKAKFGIDWNKGIIITYWPHVYCRTDITPDLIVHEGVHLVQQEAMGVEKWWEMYLSDKGFRLKQEVEAYQAQYKWAKENMNRQSRRQLLDRCAKDLSGSTYGNIVSYDEAVDLIIKL